MELHKIDIEQAFLQADKLDEGVNCLYFMNPPPGSPQAGEQMKNIVQEVLRPLYERSDKGDLVGRIPTHWREGVLFIGTPFSNLYTLVHAPAIGRVVERECCLLVLNLVSSTPPCIRQPGLRIQCVFGVRDCV
jgi:hypothetical protein